MTRGSARERGSATVVAVMMLVVLGLAGGVAADLGGLLVGKRRAAAAADLAALAGAQAVQRGSDGCSTATAAAVANRARVVSCRQHGQVVDLEVAVQVSSLGGVSSVHARARAGPG